jgi:hypothetical protein
VGTVTLGTGGADLVSQHERGDDRQGGRAQEPGGESGQRGGRRRADASRRAGYVLRILGASAR